MKSCDSCIHFEVCSPQKIGRQKLSETPCKHFKDKNFIFDILPLSLNAHLWKISAFHRSGPKATEFVVKNIKTFGEKSDIQVEVQVVGTPLRYWASHKDFFATKEEAEKEIEKKKEK